MNPEKASKLDGVMPKIEEWEASTRKYKDAQGTEPKDEDMRIIALNMLPNDLPFSFISGLRKIESWGELRSRLEEECEYYRGGANKLSKAALLHE